MGALSTCGEPDEIKKNIHPKNFTALFREQDNCGLCDANTQDRKCKFQGAVKVVDLPQVMGASP